MRRRYEEVDAVSDAFDEVEDCILRLAGGLGTVEGAIMHAVLRRYADAVALAVLRDALWAEQYQGARSVHAKVRDTIRELEEAPR